MVKKELQRRKGKQVKWGIFSFPDFSFSFFSYSDSHPAKLLPGWKKPNQVAQI